jgi:hypothetical protein
MATEVWVKAAGLMTMPAARLRAMNPVDDLVLAVALIEFNCKAEFGADAPAVRLDVGERVAAIDLRLAHTQQVKIGPFKH